MKGKMRDGRFSKAVNSRVNDFNSSISFDWRMYRWDIEGSIAHATMLAECGIIETGESEKIIAELKRIREDLDNGTLFITQTVVSDECYAAVKAAVAEHGHFDNVYETFAGCTVSCHCGPGTLGIIFVRK